MKIKHGALRLACWNISRTRLAPTPTNNSTKSDPEMKQKGTLASPATALASKVLPVPGGPNSKIPFGILAPKLWNFLGFFKKSIISLTSSFSSFKPATSLNVTLLLSLLKRALLLPKSNELLLPASCLFKNQKATPTNKTNGNTLTTTSNNVDESGSGSTSNLNS